MKTKKLMALFFASLAVVGAVFSTAFLAKPLAVNEPVQENESASAIPFSPTLTRTLGCSYGYVAPEDMTYVSRINLARYAPDEEPVVLVSDRAGVKFDLESLLSETFSVADKDFAEPLVLVVHTHGTEAYVSDDREYYYADEMFRSEDTEKNIVAVGDEFCRTLAENGIVSIHDRTMHDLASYSRAYRSSGAAVALYLEKYPTIRYVIDIHRDAVFYDNVYKKPVVELDGRTASQVMIVVGTDQNGATHPNWRENLVVALKWQQLFNELYPGFARPVYIHKSSFNQFNMPTMLLLEVGGAANTLMEAKEAAKMSANALTQLIFRY